MTAGQNRYAAETNSALSSPSFLRASTQRIAAVPMSERIGTIFTSSVAPCA